jgi:glucose/mannose-6-phosphate isomerase
VPIIVQRGYAVPPLVDADTLVIASSYSGATEETNSAFSQALNTPAKKLVMTTGGALKAQADSHNLPCFSFSYASPPRAALPYSLIPLLGILSRLGFMDITTEDIEEAVAVMELLAADINEKRPAAQNPAKALAKALDGKLCVAYGGEFLAEVGHRWKLQINENAKAWACYESIPEVDHNAVVGYRFPKQLTPHIAVVMLGSELLEPRVRQRYPITQELLKRAGIDCHAISGRGRGRLSHMLSLIMFGDYVSYYLALLNRVDPYPLDEVNYLKQALGNHNGAA